MVVFDVERLANVPTSSFKCENRARTMHVKGEPMQAVSNLAYLQGSKYINHRVFYPQECFTKRLLNIETLFQYFTVPLKHNVGNLVKQWFDRWLLIGITYGPFLYVLTLLLNQLQTYLNRTGRAEWL